MCGWPYASAPIDARRNQTRAVALGVRILPKVLAGLVPLVLSALPVASAASPGCLLVASEPGPAESPVAADAATVGPVGGLVAPARATSLPTKPNVLVVDLA